MEELKKNKAWTKKYFTKKVHETDKSFDAFNLWLEHPDWNLHKLSEETGIPYDTIKKYSSKYRYSDRRAAKAAYDSEQIHQIQLESKLINARQTSLRQIIDENILNAYANFNKNLLASLKSSEVNEETLNTIHKIDQHFINYFRMSNQQLNNMLGLETLKDTINVNTASENEFNKLAEIIKNSRESGSDE